MQGQPNTKKSGFISVEGTSRQLLQKQLEDQVNLPVFERFIIELTLARNGLYLQEALEEMGRQYGSWILQSRDIFKVSPAMNAFLQVWNTQKPLGGFCQGCMA